MTQTIVSVVLFLVILALLPLAIRWIQQRAPGSAANVSSSRIISTLAVGPQQRVVTVEVGPEGGRTWLVLGVTTQTISCLHVLPVSGRAPGAATAGSLPTPPGESA